MQQILNDIGNFSTNSERNVSSAFYLADGKAVVVTGRKKDQGYQLPARRDIYNTEVELFVELIAVTW